MAVEDRLSELPDAVILHIFSFLPTIDAVKTTILSPRWNNLWTRLPNLDFHDDDFPGKCIATSDGFMTFVDQVLSQRETLSDIRKFCIRSSNFCVKREDVSRIRCWICTAINGNIVHLELDFFLEEPEWSEPNIELKMPENIFTCKSLVSLKLLSDFITYARPKPTTLCCFPSLKLLDVTVHNVINSSFENLFCNCPVLEDLAIGGHIGGYVSNIKIFAPKLKTLRTNLTTEDCYDPYNFFVNAPMLENLYVNGADMSHYFLENPKSLVKTKFLLHEIRESRDEAYAARVTAFFAGVSSVKHLSMSLSESLELDYTSAPVFDVFNFPVFGNLKLLKIAFSNIKNWEVLVKFLERSPYLEGLVLTSGYSPDGFKPFNPPESVPICVSSHLKTISIGRFTGESDEMEVIKYLLKYSQVPNQMTISTACHPPLTPNLRQSKEELYKEILLFQKGSKTCHIECL